MTDSTATLSAPPEPREETQAQHHQAVERVIVAMRQRLDQEFTLDDMAGIAFISPFHFNRVFRRVTGVPPRRFLTAMRLEAAKRLLLTTDASVTDISLDVGYNSLGTFTRRFTQLVGLSPTQLRALKDKATSQAVIRGLCECSDELHSAPEDGGVVGEVEAPRNFRGAVFVGLFPSGIPQERPVACNLLAGSGEFRLGPISDGDYQLVTAALPWNGEPDSYLLYEEALRGGSGGCPVRVRDGRTEESAELVLRQPDLFDSPILMTFPVLIQERWQRLANAWVNA